MIIILHLKNEYFFKAYNLAYNFTTKGMYMKNKLNIAALVLFGLMTSIANAAPMGWTVDSSIDRYNSTADRSYLFIND